MALRKKAGSGRIPLPEPELCHLVPIAAGGHAAPATPMIFRRVVKEEHARLKVGTSPELFEVRRVEEASDLASKNTQGKVLST